MQKYKASKGILAFKHKGKTVIINKTSTELDEYDVRVKRLVKRGLIEITNEDVIKKPSKKEKVEKAVEEIKNS
jgi:hypothetical protein